MPKIDGSNPPVVLNLPSKVSEAKWATVGFGHNLEGQQNDSISPPIGKSGLFYEKYGFYICFLLFETVEVWSSSNGEEKITSKSALLK